MFLNLKKTGKWREFLPPQKKAEGGISTVIKRLGEFEKKNSTP